MSIRVVLCFLFVLGFSFYAYRNWFVSLLAAVGLMAVLEHPDMPKSIGGIQGLNPWNFLIFNVVVAWFRSRRKEGLFWDMPGYLSFCFVVYMLTISFSVLRLVLNDDSISRIPLFADYSTVSAVSEYFINCLKWVVPGVLLFDGCRSRRRMVITLAVILFVYFALALQVVKHMPLSAAVADGAQLSRIAGKLLSKTVGYHRVNMSMMLAGASWAVLSTLVLVSNRKHQLLLVLAAGLITLGQSLTGGRAGYVTWGAIGVILGLLRWRKLLFLLPVAVLLLFSLLPGVRERMLMGFESSSGPRIVSNDTYEITSGRTLAWARVIPKIGESPIFGYGRLAMVRTGIYESLIDDFGEAETFPHPHNAYLEMLLDNGWFGFVCVIPFYLIVLFKSFSLLLDRGDPLFSAVGGVASALLLALLIAAMGSQSFYPREGSVGMWCAIGLMLRLSFERRRSQYTGEPLFGEKSAASAPEDFTSWAEASLEAT